ncbi:MAG TPA: hypothetical protein VM163_13345 [bacterium]|nr:hypothetical protein [bacterium]
MRKRNLIVVGLVACVAITWAIIALAGQCGDESDCLSNGAVFATPTPWVFVFGVTGDVTELGLECPKVYIKPPGSSNWTDYTLTEWELITPVCKHYWKDVDFEFEGWGSGEYTYHFDSSCGRDPNSGEYYFNVNEDGEKE